MMEHLAMGYLVMGMPVMMIFMPVDGARRRRRH